MSHIVQIKTEVRDAAAVRAACQRLGLPAPVEGTTRLFSGEVDGLAFSLHGWPQNATERLLSHSGGGSLFSA